MKGAEARSVPLHSVLFQSLQSQGDKRMLNLKRLQQTKLRKTPWGQIAVAVLGMSIDYRFPRKTDIVLEGVDRLPRDHGVIFAMNHTDRYNYWPFQYELYKRKLGYTATWVKGKYYENWALGAFMDACNNIPMPSRGYLVVTEFRASSGRPPNEDEYRIIRDRLDGVVPLDAPLPDDASEALKRFLHQDGSPEATLQRIASLFGEMIDRVMDLMSYALEDLGQHILVFPQGTRSKRLLPGHTGMVEAAQHFGATIVPVGCNGCDNLYPGGSPFSKGGRVVYRIGEPLKCDEGVLSPYRVPPGVRPLTPEATRDHGKQYRAMTDIIMERINDLLDPEYQFGQADSDAERGAGRFV